MTNISTQVIHARKYSRQQAMRPQGTSTGQKNCSQQRLACGQCTTPAKPLTDYPQQTVPINLQLYTWVKISREQML